MSQRAKLFETSACFMSNSSGKGMRISEKIEVASIDDFFVGCEMVSELFAVIVGGLGHDDEAVASRIGLLGIGNGRCQLSDPVLSWENAKGSYTSGRDEGRRW